MLHPHDAPCTRTPVEFTRALDIVDLGGRRVRRLVPQHDTARWDGDDAFGRPAPAGIYLVRAAGDPGDPAIRIVRVTR